MRLRKSLPIRGACTAEVDEAGGARGRRRWKVVGVGGVGDAPQIQKSAISARKR